MSFVDEVLEYEALCMGRGVTLVDSADLAGCVVALYDCDPLTLPSMPQRQLQRRLVAYRPDGTQMFSSIVSTGYESPPGNQKSETT